MAAITARSLVALTLLKTLAALTLLTGCFSPSRMPASSRAMAVYQESIRLGGEPSAPVSIPATLTADQAVEMVMRRSTRVRSANARAAAAEAVAEEEGQLENPELRIQNLRLDQVLDREPRVDVGLRFSPPRPGELEAASAQARAEGREARAEAVLEAQLEEAEVRLLFSEALLFDAEIEAAGEAVASQWRLVELIRARAERGLSTRLEEISAELEARETEQERELLKADREIAFGALMDRLGLPEKAPVRLLGDTRELSVLPNLPDEEQAVVAALKNRPEIAAAAARIDAAEASIYVEKAARWPWLSFFEVGYTFAPRIPDGLAWSVGAAIELPLFSTNGGAILRAEADRTAAKRLLEAEVHRIVLEVRSLHRECRVARDLVRAYSEGPLPTAERASAEAKKAIEAAQVDALLLESIEEQRVKVMMDKLSLLRRFYTALAGLSAAVGGKLPPARAPKR